MKRNRLTLLALLFLFPLVSLAGCSIAPSSSELSGSSESTSVSSEEPSSSSSEPEEYTLTFNTNGGSSITPLVVTEGSSVSAPTAPTKIGYTFAGWYSDLGLTTPYVFTVMPSQNITIYAKWTVNQYTISFEENGGPVVSDITQDYGSSVATPTAPVREGYTFSGWYSDALLTNVYTFSTMPAENITVYLKWIINQYTISFEENGGSEVANITQDYGTALAAPNNPTRAGYTFAGWFADISLVSPYSFTTMLSENITLYAKWEIDPAYGTMSVAAFKALPSSDTDYHEILGVVILCSTGMGMIVVADETGVVLGLDPSLEALKGDLVKIGGFLNYMDGFNVMAKNEATVDVTIYDHDVPIPYPPELIGIADYNAFNPEDKTHWAVYASLSGTLSFDSETQMPILTSGTDQASCFPLDMEALQGLQLYEGLEVIVNGMIFPNYDEAEPFLMFLFTGDLTFVNHLDNEVLDTLEQLFRNHFETPTYYPNQFLDLPDNFPLVGATIAYATTGVNAGLFNLETMKFDASIQDPVDIGLDVTITLSNNVARTIHVTLHAAQLTTITIAELKTKTDYDPEVGDGVLYAIRGVIMFSQPSEGFTLYLVLDATGEAYINSTDESLAIGDEIVALGYKMTMGPTTVLFNDPAITVVQILAHNQPLPMIPIAISIADFAALSPSGLSFVYYELSGTLILQNPGDPENSYYGITDGTNIVMIYHVNAEAKALLATHADQAVTIRGFSMIAGDPGSEMVLLAFFVFTDSIATNPT